MPPSRAVPHPAVRESQTTAGGGEKRVRGGTLFLRRACGKLTAARLSDKSHFLFGSLMALTPLRTSQGEPGKLWHCGVPKEDDLHPDDEMAGETAPAAWLAGRLLLFDKGVLGERDAKVKKLVEEIRSRENASGNGRVPQIQMGTATRLD